MVARPRLHSHLLFKSLTLFVLIWVKKAKKKHDSRDFCNHDNTRTIFLHQQDSLFTTILSAMLCFSHLTAARHLIGQTPTYGRAS